MSRESLSFWDYLKAAFNLKVPTPLLGAMPLNKLALVGFGIFGLVNQGFWLLGLGFETAYLMLLAGNERFQNWVRATRMAPLAEPRPNDSARTLEQFNAAARERYLRLLKQCSEMSGGDQGSSDTSGFGNLKAEGLNQLLAIFAKLLNLKYRITDTLSKTRRQDLETDIKALQQKIAVVAETSPVLRSLKGTLDIQQARLENLDKSLENLRYTDAELDRIEKQVSLIAEEAAVSKNPEQWSASLDGVVTSIQSTNKWMVENEQLFETLSPPSLQAGTGMGGRNAVAVKR